MSANVASLQQNYSPDKKNVDVIQKDIRKWVESVAEFKANLDKQQNDLTIEKHTKRSKKLKVKKKPSLVTVPTNVNKKVMTGQRKVIKTVKTTKKPINQPSTEKTKKKEAVKAADAFDEILQIYKNVKLPQNWTAGTSNGRLVFNRIKMSTLNTLQKMKVERSLVITKDRNVHVLINGSEISLNNWETHKIENADDLKKAILEVDGLKICDSTPSGSQSPQCSLNMESKVKSFQGSKSETASPQKTTTKKNTKPKKDGEGKGVTKLKSFQK